MSAYSQHDAKSHDMLLIFFFCLRYLALLPDFFWSAFILPLYRPAAGYAITLPYLPLFTYHTPPDATT